jgi:hypothetical protein
MTTKDMYIKIIFNIQNKSSLHHNYKRMQTLKLSTSKHNNKHVPWQNLQYLSLIYPNQLTCLSRYLPSYYPFRQTPDYDSSSSIDPFPAFISTNLIKLRVWTKVRVLFLCFIAIQLFLTSLLSCSEVGKK